MSYEPVNLLPAADRLKGKVAVVAGASTGIGAAAGVLASRGAAVVFAARRADKLAAEITVDGGLAVSARAAVSPTERALAEESSLACRLPPRRTGHASISIGVFRELLAQDLLGALGETRRTVERPDEGEVPDRASSDSVAGSTAPSAPGCPALGCSSCSATARSART